MRLHIFCSFKERGTLWKPDFGTRGYDPEAKFMKYPSEGKDSIKRIGTGMQQSRTHKLSLYIWIVLARCCSATDTLIQSQQLSAGQTLISASEVFELGFFSPGNSTKQYVGIWYKDILQDKVVWVANRENPLSATVTDKSSSLVIGSDGNLQIQDGKLNIAWSTNVSFHSNQTYAVLSDKGEFCLFDSLSGSVLWDSFDYPGDTLIPTMMLGVKINETGKPKHLLSSWKSDDDPSPGKFTVGLSSDKPPQAFIWSDSMKHWRSGPWDGGKFVGIPDQVRGYSGGITIIPDNQQGAPYLTLNTFNLSYFLVLSIKPGGYLEAKNRGIEEEWNIFWKAPDSTCDIYGACGPFAICRKKMSPICECLKGFVPKSSEEWSKGNWTNGCLRQTELYCEKNASSLALGRTKVDGFWRVSRINLPDLFDYLFSEDDTGCRQWCLSNCSCTAYSFVAGIGCMVWAGELLDIQQLSFYGQNLFLRLAQSELGDDTKGKQVTIGFTTASAVLLLVGITFALLWWRAYKRGWRSGMVHFNPDDTTISRQNSKQDALQGEPSELPMFDFAKIVTATNSFSWENKLGEGGFGPVYKGLLDNGQQIAVKRLSSHSGQGVMEFKNEILLISELQHRNLVKLLGCCIEGEERLLIYEYMTNKSLDTFLFDSRKQPHLDWKIRFNIIEGIARGIVYLHRDSCLRIIHRDLKTSNILLDDQMNPKISDFGLARTFGVTQEQANTHRIAGTFGYMSPEYAIGGVFSEKSDVFSFGVMLLEIISGTRNTSSFQHEQINLLGYAWELWSTGRGSELIDQALGESRPTSEVLRCIHVGLLCVQDFAEDRPTMSTVVLMLGSDSDLPRPKQPLFTVQRTKDSGSGQEHNRTCSANQVTISMTEGR